MADPLGLAQGCVVVYSMSITQTKGHTMNTITRLAATTKASDGFIHTTYWDSTDRATMENYLDEKVARGEILTYWVR